MNRAPAPSVPRKPPLLRRLGPALGRRARLAWRRLRHPRARFGAGCDIRRGLCLYIEEGGRVRFGPRCVLDRDMTIEARGLLDVGAGTIFGHHVTLGVNERVSIGDDCLIAEMVAIRDHDHRHDRLDVPIRDQGSVSAPVTIGRNVWLGGKVTVLKGVTIGDNAIVGANAVVSRDIPANAIAVGVPARVIRMREAS